MNPSQQTPCRCATCPGATCNCGCQQAAAPAACACGPACQCGSACACPKG